MRMARVSHQHARPFVTTHSRGRRRCAAAPRAQTGCRLLGSGCSVPETTLSNADLEQLVETDDAWITTRTGIRKRHILGPGETLSWHAAEAARRALAMAGVEGGEVDLVLLATSTPDDLFGSACQVQAAIGAKLAVAFDITAACSGFVVALITAAHLIRSRRFRRVVVIGGDALSRFIDWRDRGTCILFGDGCGAVVLSAAEEEPCSLLGASFQSDGAGRGFLNANFLGADLKAHSASPSGTGSFSNIAMNGQEVFKFAVRAVPQVVRAALAEAGLAAEEVDWLVLHQANQRILDAVATRLGVPQGRVLSNLAEYGNTSAASIPIVLDEAVRSGQVAPGQKLVLAGFGAGLTWTAAVVRWG